MSLKLPKCDFCKYCYDDTDKTRTCCKAFPDGIPLKAMIADKEEECNNGIKYEENKIP